jgi:hypothetical protein
MSERLTAEALVAITGLWPSRAPDLAQLERAENLPARWRSKVRRWLRADAPRPFAYEPPPVSQDRLREKLEASPSIDDVTLWLSQMGDEIIGAHVVDVIRDGREYCRSQWPQLTISELLPEPLPLSRDEYEEVWSLVRVATDPDVLFDELESWTLTGTQIALWRAVFPELAAMVDDIIATELIEFVAQGKDLAWQHEDAIRALRGLPPETQIAVKLPTQEEPPSPKPGWDIDFKATRTAAEDSVARD